jgi:protein ImuA
MPALPSPTTAASSRPVLDVGGLAVWRATELGHAEVEGVGTGFALLDAELPGRGWPTGAVTELLQPQASIAEWRLLLPALAPLATAARPLLVVGPPHEPYAAGLRRYGLSERHLVLVRADAPARRLWAVEQAARASGLAGVIAWLPHARPAQMRRLQVLAAQTGALVFVVRPEAARHESSPVPLRVLARLEGLDGLAVHVLKRRGQPHEGWVRLSAWPPGLQQMAEPLAQLQVDIPWLRRAQRRRGEGADAVAGAAVRSAVRHP